MIHGLIFKFMFFRIQRCLQSLVHPWIKHLLPLQRILLNQITVGSPRAAEERNKRSHKPSTFIRCWSKFIPTLESRLRPWVSWIRSWMISSRGSLSRLVVLLITARSLRYPRGKFRRQLGCFFRENLPSMRFRKAKRLFRSKQVLSRVLFVRQLL